MNQDMTHAFYYVSIYICVRLTEFFGQHIDRFAYDFYMFYKTVKKYSIISNFLKFIALLIFQQNIDGIQYMLQSAYFLSYIKILS